MLLCPPAVITLAAAEEAHLMAQVYRGIVPQAKDIPSGWLPARIVFAFQGVNYTARFMTDSETYNSLSKAMGESTRPGNLPARLRLVGSGVEHVQPLADALRKAAPTSDPETLAAFTLAFVQALPYKLDALTTPFDEAWRAPLQTLVDQEIDCEDSAILFTSLLSALGLDSGLVLVPRHVMAAVAGDFRGNYLEFQKRRYYLAETTGLSWEIGQVPDIYKGTRADLLPVAASAAPYKPAVQVLPGKQAITPSSPLVVTPDNAARGSEGNLLPLMLFFLFATVLTALGWWWFQGRDMRHTPETAQDFNSPEGTSGPNRSLNGNVDLELKDANLDPEDPWRDYDL